MSARHILLISGAAPDSKSVAAIMSAMRLTGGLPMLIANHSERVGDQYNVELIAEEAAKDIAKANGIIVMGNDMDIDPGDYGETKIHIETKSEKNTHKGRVRAAYEYKLIQEALKKKIPLLGICGGMQRLNVFLGGTLHQHIPELVGSAYRNQATTGIAPFIPVQYVSVVLGTMLAKISREIGGLFTPGHDDLLPGVFMENSFHHQAVDKIGKGLIPCAYSIEKDHPELQIVQAVEADPKGPFKGQFVLGVQWHPEFGASDVSARVLQNYNATVELHAKAHQTKISPEEALAVTAKSMFNVFGEFKSGGLEKPDPGIPHVRTNPGKPKPGRKI